MNTPSYRRILLPLLALTAVFSAAGCWEQGPLLRPYFGADATLDGSNVVVFLGDSIGAMAEVDARAAIKTVGPDQRWSYNAQGGTQIDQWDEAMANRCATLDDGTPIIDPAAPCIPTNGTIVAELLTNDVTLNDHYQIAADLYAALDSLTDVRCVVIPLLNTEGGDRRGTPYSSRTHWVNDELERLVNEGVYPNLHLVHWDQMSDGQPELLMGNAATPVDWVHYNGLGNPVVAEMIAHAPEACSA